MSLAVGQNSWATVAEADTYLNDRIHADNWFGLNSSPANPGEVAKESLLISAFYWLLGDSQLNLNPSLTDTNVKNAQIEASLFFLNHYAELDERRSNISMGVESFRLSKRSENLDLDSLTIPKNIIGLLKDYLTVMGGTFAILKGEYDSD